MDEDPLDIASQTRRKEERAKLEDKVQERTVKLRRFNEIGRTITAIRCAAFSLDSPSEKRVLN